MQSDAGSRWRPDGYSARDRRVRPRGRRTAAWHRPRPLLPDCGEVTKEQAAVGKTGLGAEEGKSSGRVELDQPGEEQAAEEHAQHPHRQEEGRTGRYPAPPVERYAAARHDHVDMRMVTPTPTIP